MLQIGVVVVFLIVAAFTLTAREIQATKHRVVKGASAKLLGCVALGCAALPILFDPLDGTVFGVVAFLTASAIAIGTSAPAPKPAPAEDGARRSPPRPQVVGEKCASCSDAFMSELEATGCAKCGVPVHHQCMKAHQNASHPKKARARAAAAA